MPDTLKQILYNAASVSGFTLPELPGKGIHITGLKGSLPAVLISYLVEARNCSVLYISTDSDKAECMRDDLELLLGTTGVSFFPPAEIAPYDDHEPNPSLVRLRLETLRTLIAAEKGVVVATVGGLLNRVPDPDVFVDHCIMLSRSHSVDFTRLIEQLAGAGYERVPFVESVGQFSVRGGILDIYPWTHDDAVRIEFFGNIIESIRSFNVVTQRSIEELDGTDIIPNLSIGQTGGSLLGYLRTNTVILYEDKEMIRAKAAEFFEYAHARYGDHTGQKLQPEQPGDRYFPWEILEKKLSGYLELRMDLVQPKGVNTFIFESTLPVDFGGHLNRFFAYLKKIHQEKYRVFIQCESGAQAGRLKEILEEEGLEHTASMAIGSFHTGFIFPEVNVQVLTDHEIFGRFKRRHTYKRFKSGEYLRSLNSLNLQDYVVHIDYGIGQYMGVAVIESGTTRRECIRVQYAEGDSLYVSVDRLNRVQKFSSEEGAAPRLSKLGSGEWEKTKKRTRESIEKIAQELLQVQVARKTMPAFSFNSDTHWQKELEASFTYDETEDQLRAIAEVKRDLESEAPMDRLLCGDVGYGKTEVALRAAFKVNMDGKQVAILVPTTILAYQHFQTFRERMVEFPIKIEMLSRFRSAREQQKILDQLSRGEIDIVIATHRLLSEDVRFKDLGLLIIDEEQRFGVKHKEKLKSLRASVDILTMTATPIPRTLHLSLMGARDLSHIETPPRNRLPVYTEILEWDDHQIRRVIQRELQRQGQVYFVHNRVQTIEGIRSLVQQIVPEARVAVAHGQLPEKKLEQIMLDFIHKKYDVLISTMIIENGLDIPNVNTIVINRADKFGLAQLYQLRGRVGRAMEQAYAYLLIPPVNKLTSLAQKRLRAIQDFTELGSGFKLALRDMEIRGIGNILGKEQSGNIQSVGFDLYCRILDEAVKKMKSSLEITALDTFLEQETDPKLDVDFDLVIPPDYISSEQERIALYHKMVNYRSFDDLDKITAELMDRFGPVPPSVFNLIYAIKMKIIAGKVSASHVLWKSKDLVLNFSQERKEDPLFFNKILPALLQQKKTKVQFLKNKEGLGIQIRLGGDTREQQVDFAKNLLQSMV